MTKIMVYDPAVLDQHHLDGMREATQDDITRLQRIEQAHGRLLEALRAGVRDAAHISTGIYKDPHSLSPEALITYMRVEDYRQLISDPDLDDDVRNLMKKSLGG